MEGVSTNRDECNGVEWILSPLQARGFLGGIMGYIYKITNKLNDKVYIGQTVKNCQKRWTQHKSAARTAKNNKIIFYNAINKYGEDNFTIDVIYEVSCITKDELIDELNDLEIYYIFI